MADWELSQLAVRATPAVTDYVPLLVPTDTSTPPADLNGSDQRATLGQLASFAAGSLAQKATVYVTTGGSDGNDGLSWATAKLTVQAAINALPTTSSIQGGIVEVGYGKFTVSTPIVIASTQNVWLRGRGPGQAFDSTNNQTTPVYTTELHNSGTGDLLQITGPSNFGPAGSPTNTGVAVSDMSLTGTSSSTYGINATYTEGIRLENLNIDQHGVFGIRQSKVFGMLLRNVYISRCGTVGASTPTGGHFLDPSLGSNPGVNYLYSECALNFGYGIYDGGSPTTSTGMVLSHSVFQNNAASAKAASGVGLFSGGNWAAFGCDFEANALYNIYAETGGQGALFGCDVLGDSVSTSGIYNGHSAGSVLAVHGCRFAGHSSYSINNASENFVSWTACTSSDSAGFMFNAAGNVIPADGLAPSVTGTTGGLLTGFFPQTLASNGAVTLFPSAGLNAVTLNANATSSVAAIGPPGQFLDLTLIQGAGGSHTWAWFTNVKWVGASAPTISTTAAFQDNFRFVSDGTNWRECYRAIGTH